MGSFKPLSTFLKGLTSAFFSSEVITGMQGNKPGAAGSGSEYANHCAILPPEDEVVQPPFALTSNEGIGFFTNSRLTIGLRKFSFGNANTA